MVLDAEFFQESLDPSSAGNRMAIFRLRQRLETFSKTHPSVRVVSSHYSATPYVRKEVNVPPMEEILHTLYLLYER